MKNTYIAGGVVAFIGLVVASGFMTQGTVAGTSTRPIKIGATICLTTVCAEWGENELKGMQLAIKDINAKGGVLGRQLELTVQDSAESDVKNAVNAYQALRQQNIQYIVGPTWTPAALALAPMASKDDVVMVAASVGVADFNEVGENLFNTWVADEKGTRFLARHMYAEGSRKVAVFSSLQPWEKAQGDAFEDEFTKLGGTVTIKIEANDDAKDLRTEALKVKNSNPDTVVFTNLTDMGTAAKELKRLGYAGSQASILMDDKSVEIADGALDGTVYVQSPKSQQWFIDAYTKEYGTAPGVAADTAYDAVQLLAKGMTDAGTTDLAQVQKTMNAYREFKGGAAGDVTFDGTRGVVKDPVLWVVQGTKLVELAK
jgi:branched-chain amino acid transport system substrate-binding protein